MDFKALAEKAAAISKDMNVATTGGGDYEPPAAGPTRLRFISYIEIGKQKDIVMGKPKVRDTAILTFELSGPKHKPTIGDDGKAFPHRISMELAVSLNEKAHFYRVFRALNWAGKAKHISQLLGESYKGEVVHRKYKGRDGKDRINADLYDKAKGVYTIGAPRYEVVNGPESDNPGPTGEFAVLPVDAPISPIKCFIWDLADIDQWNAIFIEGEYAERKDADGTVTSPAKSRNVIQAKVRLAENFKGSPIYTVLAANGGSLDIPDAEAGRDETTTQTDETAPASSAPETPQGDAATDALNAVAGAPSLGL